MKKVIPLAAVLIPAALYFAGHHHSPGVAQAAESRKTAFLIRFGIDGKPDVDWSGRIDPAPVRITGWQFDRNDAIQGAGWKCVTREENYWDTPYERLMRPTSNRDKVTGKGVVVEYDAAVSGELRVSTAQGDFSFAMDAALWAAPRRYSDGRVEVRSA